VTINSYAQNYEDVILWRALSHVENGTYVDIGAAYPIDDSVTMLFYEKGWTGVNVEPDARLFQLLNSERTRDTNLSVAIGRESGRQELFIVSNQGLSTLDIDVAREHEAAGFAFQVQPVEIKTLCAVLETTVEDSPIHFLKVDVEGAESDVLASNDWSRFRPWIVVVETAGQQRTGENLSAPSTSEPAVQLEDYMSSVDYECVYFDGLNSFFVANEHPELFSRPVLPPNVFDNFITSSEERATRRSVAMEAQAHQAELRAIRIAQMSDQAAAASAREIATLTNNIENLSLDLHNLQESVSWRITRPLRTIKGLTRGH
jgi:FkbM family methyltransferase